MIRSLHILTTKKFIYSGFFLVLVTLVLLGYYLTPLGSKVEAKLYSFRTLIKPDPIALPQIVLLDFVSPANLEAAVRHSLSASPASINIVLTEPLFYYSWATLKRLDTLLSHTPRLHIVAIDHLASDVTSSPLPAPALSQLRAKIFELGSQREQAGYMDYFIIKKRDSRGKLSLPYYLGRDVPRDAIHLNLFAPEKLQKINLGSSAVGATTSLADKHVFIGLNPDTSSEPSGEEGAFFCVFGGYQCYSKVQYAAIVIANFLFEEYFIDISFPYAMIQTVVITAVFVLIWKLGISWATMVIISCWLLLFLVHGFLMAYFHLYWRLGDTILFSSIAAMVGAVWRLNVESQIRFKKELETMSHKNFAIRKSQFLDSFADGLRTINDRILRFLMHEDIQKFAQNESRSGIFIKLFSSSEDLRDYIRSIRQLSSISSVINHTDVKSRFSASRMIERVVLQFDKKCMDRKIKVEVNCDKNLEIYGVETIIENILHNLVSNAIKYSPANEEVIVSVIKSGNGGVEISVEDHGPGIPTEYHKTIFEKFFRVNQENLVKIKGSGLGLFLCRFFARKIGARLNLKSQLGEGSTFYIHLVEESD